MDTWTRLTDLRGEVDRGGGTDKRRRRDQPKNLLHSPWTQTIVGEGQGMGEGAGRRWAKGGKWGHLL